MQSVQSVATLVLKSSELTHNALIHELQLCGIPTSYEVQVEVLYKNLIVGKHRLDLLIDGQVVIELKAIAGITSMHIAQVLSYMKAVGSDTGLIINFGDESLRWKRLIRKPRIERV